MKNQEKIEGRPGESLPPINFETLREKLEDRHGNIVRDVDVVSSALYPKVTDEFLDFRDKYGPVDALDTRMFFVGPKMAEEVEVSWQSGWWSTGANSITL